MPGNESGPESGRTSVLDMTASSAIAYAAQRSSPETSAQGRNELMQALVSGLLLAVTAACGRLLCPWLFFIDDFQACFLPTLIAIGRSLRQGEFPLLTSTTWTGGNFLGEYQYAIFNPFVLVLSLLSSYVRSVDIAALTIVLPSLVFVGFAVHHAARSVDIPTSGARTAALMVGLGNFLLVWYASSWLPGLYSLPWVVLLWSFLHRYVRRDGAWYPWVLCIAGLLTSGWPYAVLAGAVLALVYVPGAAEKHGALLAGGIVGVLLGSVAILPVLEYLPHTRRAASAPVQDMLRVTWDGLLATFIPLSTSLWQGFEGTYLHADLPIGYLNALLVFLVPCSLRARLRGRRPSSDERDLDWAVVLFLLLVGLPLPAFFHWPVRFLPILHVFLSVFCLRWWSERRPDDEFSGGALLGLVAFGVVLGLQQSQSWQILAINAALLGCGAAVFRRAYRQRAGQAELLLCIYTVAVFFVQMQWYGDKLPMADWGVDDRVWKSGSPKRTLSLFTSTDMERPVPWNVGTLGNVNLLTETPAVNGYSAFQIDGTFNAFFSGSVHSTWGATGPEIVERLRERAPGCDETWLDVLGVERLLVFRGHQGLLPGIREWLSDWHESRVGRVVVLERPGPQSLVACATAGLSAQILTTSSRETVLRVVNRADHEGQLFVRRQWFPGYRAWFDGLEVPLRGVRHIVVAVRIPPNSSGTLLVRFAPRSLQLGGVLSGIGLLGLIYGIRRSARPRRRTRLASLRRTTHFASCRRMVSELRDMVGRGRRLRELVARELADRYAQSTLGFLWTMLSPVLMMAVLCFVFSHLLPVTVEHFSVYVLSALVLWNFIAQATSWSAESFRSNPSLLKTDVPAGVHVLATVLAAAVNFFISLVPLAIVMLVLGHSFSPALAFLPVPIALTMLFALGISLALAPLSALSADIIPIYQLVLTASMFLTPIFYPLSVWPAAYRRFLVLNPMTHLVEAFRNPIYQGVLPSRNVLITSTVAGLGTLLIGWLIFQRAGRGRA